MNTLQSRSVCLNWRGQSSGARYWLFLLLPLEECLSSSQPDALERMEVNGRCCFSIYHLAMLPSAHPFHHYQHRISWLRGALLKVKSIKMYLMALSDDLFLNKCENFALAPSRITRKEGSVTRTQQATQ